MKVRAAVFDVYHTLLQPAPSTDGTDRLWQELFHDFFGSPPPYSLAEFSTRAKQVVERQHTASRAQGIPCPEILWPSVVVEVVPPLARLAPDTRADFILRQMQISRRFQLAEGAAECLRYLTDRGSLLGIASNAQAYTVCELATALGATGMDISRFDPHLRFWSYENGFSKPDPHVFRLLTARFEDRGINPAQILMVGDRLDNDIAPARSFGWQTWRIGAPHSGPEAGTWQELLAWLKQDR